MQIFNYAQAISVLTTMEANLPTFAGVLGTTAADQTFLTNSLANMVYVGNFTEVFDDNKKGFTAIKQRLFNGDTGAIPDGPVTEEFNPPFSPLQGDVHGQLMLLIGRIQSSNNYTHEIGVALGIESSGDAPTPPVEDIQATIDLFPAQSDYTFSVVVSGREASDSWVVEIMPTGASEWVAVGTYTGKSADVKVTPTTPGQPMQLQVRVRLRKNNADYGKVSAALTTVVSP